MTRDEFFKEVHARREALLEKREKFESELIEALMSRLNKTRIDRDENLVFRIDIRATPFKGVEGVEFHEICETIPWIVSAEIHRNLLIIAVREIPETFVSTIKPVIGFHS